MLCPCASPELTRGEFGPRLVRLHARMSPGETAGGCASPEPASFGHVRGDMQRRESVGRVRGEIIALGSARYCFSPGPCKTVRVGHHGDLGGQGVLGVPNGELGINDA